MTRSKAKNVFWDKFNVIFGKDFIQLLKGRVKGNGRQKNLPSVQTTPRKGPGKEWLWLSDDCAFQHIA